MSTNTESDSRATSADFGRTTDDVMVKMPDKVIVRQLEKQKNSAYSVVEGDRVEWEAGDALHMPPWSWHQHFNTDPDKEVKFLSGTNAPLLQSVGDIDYREEAE
ncbi:MAG: cupin domain-containing protein [Candidatus Scalindua sp.]